MHPSDVVGDRARSSGPALASSSTRAPPGIHDHGAPTRRGARSENAAAEFTYSARWSRIGRAHRRGGRCGHAKSTVRCGVWRDAMIRLRVNARSCAGEFAYVVHSEHRQCRPVLCDCLSTCSDDLFEKRTDLLEARSRRRSSVQTATRATRIPHGGPPGPRTCGVQQTQPTRRAPRGPLSRPTASQAPQSSRPNCRE